MQRSVRVISKKHITDSNKKAKKKKAGTQKKVLAFFIHRTYS